VPGLLLSLLDLGYIGTVAYAWPDAAPALPTAIGPKTRAEFWRLLASSFLPPLFLIGLVLGSIYGGWATPTEAAGVGSAGALLLAALRRKLSLRTLRAVIEQAGLTNAMVFFLFFGATMFSYVFRSLGGDDIVRELLAAAGIDSGWKIIVFLQVLVFVLGFFFDWIEITLIVLPIFAPVLLQIDFSEHLGGGAGIAFLTWFVIVLSVNLQTSFLTPPFGFTLFCMRATIPPSVTMAQIYRGSAPFVILQLAGLFLTIVYPEVVLWLPRRLGLLY
jgi:tripartite ATP-independent transporter DctM subunit